MLVPVAVNKRVGHIVVPYGVYAVAWGGFVADQDSGYCAANEVFVYDSKSGIWSKIISTGDVPRPLSGCSAAIWLDELYIFGGCGDPADPEEGTRRHYNDLYRLNLKSRVWTKLNPSGTKSPPPCDKGVAWAYNNRIYFYGGYGPRLSFFNSNYDFSLDLSGGYNGWNNSFYCYDIESNSWSPVAVKRPISTPEPRAAAAADVKGHIAFVFGGRKGSGRTNDLYAFNMSTNTWSSNLNEGLKSEENEVPEPRSWTSFDFVDDYRAIVYGGLNASGLPAMDWWECRFNESYDSVAWTLGKSPIEPRIWHASAFCSPGELIIVGGGIKNPYFMDEKNHAESTRSLNCQPPPLYRLSLNAVTDNLLLATGFIGRASLPQTLENLVICRHNQRGISPELLASDNSLESLRVAGYELIEIEL